MKLKLFFIYFVYCTTKSTKCHFLSELKEAVDLLRFVVPQINKFQACLKEWKIYKKESNEINYVDPANFVYETPPSSPTERARNKIELTKEKTTASKNLLNESFQKIRSNTEGSNATTSRNSSKDMKSDIVSLKNQSSERRTYVKSSRNISNDERSLAKSSRNIYNDERSLAESSRNNSNDERSLAESSRNSSNDERSLAESSRNNSNDERSLAESSRNSSNDERSLAKSSRNHLDDKRLGEKLSKNGSNPERSNSKCSRIISNDPKSSSLAPSKKKIKQMQITDFLSQMKIRVEDSPGHKMQECSTCFKAFEKLESSEVSGEDSDLHTIFKIVLDCCTQHLQRFNLKENVKKLKLAEYNFDLGAWVENYPEIVKKRYEDAHSEIQFAKRGFVMDIKKFSLAQKKMRRLHTEYNMYKNFVSQQINKQNVWTYKDYREGKIAHISDTPTVKRMKTFCKNLLPKLFGNRVKGESVDFYKLSNTSEYPDKALEVLLCKLIDFEKIMFKSATENSIDLYIGKLNENPDGFLIGIKNDDSPMKARNTPVSFFDYVGVNDEGEIEFHERVPPVTVRSLEFN